MAIKISVDLADATFAELSAVIGYAHQLGVSAEDKLTFEGTVLSIEFEADHEPDEIFTPFEDADFDDTDAAGPLYVDDLIGADREREEDAHYRARRRGERPSNEDVVTEIGEAISNFVQGIIGDNGRGGRGGYGSFGPFGPFGPNDRGNRW